ncbi:Maf family protein [Candidatus Omnitrophota bacterium]
MKEIILASASERRSSILSSCGIDHRVVVSGVEEEVDEKLNISDIVVNNAVRKAEKTAPDANGAIVIGADTLVVHGSDILGKPGDEAAAREMLKRFSGGEVEVYTGLCVIDAGTGKKAKGFEKSGLFVVSLTDEKVERYFRLLAPYDKAGGFSIEGVGSLLFDDIRGSYFNILGLPMMKLAELFEQVELDILDFIKK